MIRLLLTAVIAGAGVQRSAQTAEAQEAAASQCSGIERISTEPGEPIAGTMFAVNVMMKSGRAGLPQATIAGEPLHFVRRGDSLSALAAVPVDSSSGITLRIDCGDFTAPGRTMEHRITVRPGAYKLDRLTVAPRFTAEPDSQLAARMSRESAMAAAVSGASHSTPRLWRDAFAAPRNSRITSGFGNGRTFNGTVTSRHMGTDFAGAAGAPVQAINRGVVRLVDSFYLGGNVIYIDHGEGVVSAYLHLSRALVAPGDTVERGARIGLVGATGRVTGPHLHLITRFGRITVDALSVIGRAY